jgi:DNA topoisomerase IA
MKLSDFEQGVYRVGKVVNAVSCTYERQRTEPPSRYTQSDLMDDMMAAYKFAKTDAERAVLNQISGLGTSRTREPTITSMITRGFLTVRKAGRGRIELVPSDAARSIISHLPEMLTSVAMTAKWELAFRLVEQGKASADDVRQHLRATLDNIVADARANGGFSVQQAPSAAPARSAARGGAPAARPRQSPHAPAPALREPSSSTRAGSRAARFG